VTEQFSGRMLRIYFREHASVSGKPLADVIIDECRTLGLSCVVALRGVEGFGESAIVRRHAPMTLTIIDRPEQIRKLIPFLDRLDHISLVVASDVEAIRLTSRQ
jgi:PII-like signaling protein